jgi:hypothetical protein
MFPKAVRRTLAAFSSLAIAGTVAVALPMSADAATSRAYGGSAYGSSGKFGTVISLGRTANQPFCTTASNVSRTNNSGATSRAGLGTIGAQVTKVQSVKNGATQSSITTSTTNATNLLSGAVSFSSLVSKATVTLNSSGYQLKGETKFVGLQVLGTPVPDQTPAPNTTFDLPLGQGQVILNQQGTLNKFGLKSQGVNGLRLILNPGNTFGLPAGEMVLSYSLASLHSPTTRRAYGVAYATKSESADTVQSGASAAVNLPCGGSSGVTRTNNAAVLNAPGIFTGGSAVTTAKSTDSPTSTNATTTARISNVNFLSGVVTADAIKAVSSTTKKGTTYSRSSAGTEILDLRINGTPVTTPIGPNTTRTIPGVGTLYMRRSVWSSTGMDVIALQLVLSNARGSLPAGTVITAGFAQSGVV